MFLWKTLTRAFARSSGSARARRPRLTPGRRSPVMLSVEELEQRCLLAVTSSVVGGVLTASSNAGDNIAITASGGNVQVNGADPNSGAAAASSIAKIVIHGGPQSNTIDLTGVDLGTFTALTMVNVTEGGGGNNIVKVGVDGIAATETIDAGAGANNTIRFTTSGIISFVTQISEGTPATVYTFSRKQFVGQLSVTNEEFSVLDLPLVDLIINYGPSTDPRIIGDDATPNDGFSSSFDPITGQRITFRNPISELVLNGNNASDNHLILHGLDTAGPPQLILLNGGAGNDTLTADFSTGAAASIFTSINGNGGNDQIDVSHGGLARLQVMGGTGDDTIKVHDMEANSITVDGGDGNDNITVYNVGTSSLLVMGGIGNDTVVIHDVGATSILVNGATGNNNITVYNVGFNTMSINGGAGNDTVDIHNVGGSVLNVNGGDGNDVVTIRNAGFGSLDLDGGNGTDTLNLDFSTVGFNSLSKTNFEN